MEYFIPSPISMALRSDDLYAMQRRMWPGLPISTLPNFKLNLVLQHAVPWGNEYPLLQRLAGIDLPTGYGEAAYENLRGRVGRSWHHVLE